MSSTSSNRDDVEQAKPFPSRSRRPYNPPAVRPLGTVEELTENAGNAGNPDGTYPASNYGG